MNLFLIDSSQHAGKKPIGHDYEPSEETFAPKEVFPADFGIT